MADGLDRSVRLLLYSQVLTITDRELSLVEGFKAHLIEIDSTTVDELNTLFNGKD